MKNLIRACLSGAILAAAFFCTTADASVMCPTNPDGSCIPVPAGSDTLAVLSSLVVSPPSVPGTNYTLETITETDEANTIAISLPLNPPGSGLSGGGYSSAVLQLNEPGTSIYSDQIYITSNIIAQDFGISMNSDPFFLSFTPTAFLDETGDWQDVSAFFDLNSGTIFVASDLDTPLPATLPLFATGLGGLGLLGWHRKRKAQLSGQRR
jgi:hypothetical protein